jgi:glutathione S-transferase
MSLKLVIGNKNYSSWSMRPWLALRANNIAFEEVFIPLYTGDADKKRILDFTGSGKVPVLIDGDVTVWDSLAIIEYLAERFPETRLWPEEQAHRAHARSISAEMHSGFARSRYLDRVPRAIWQIRAVSVRRLRRGGRHVRAGGASFSQLRDRGDAKGAALHGYDDGVAGVSGMDQGGAGRNSGD